MSSDRWEQARAYVESMRQDGRTDDEIRQGLRQAGWPQEQVERLLAPEMPQPPGAEAPPPAPGARAQDDSSERYHEIAETVGMIPSVRARDNVIQGIVVAVGTLIGAGIGALAGGLIGALGGALVGLIVFTFISGFVLMIAGGSRAIKKRADRQQ